MKGWIVLAFLAASCGGSSSAPTPTAPLVPQGLPIVLSGQSNALYMGYLMPAAYPPGVTVTARSSTPLSWWDDNGPQWPDLVAALSHGALTAFVWWQGEQDALDAVTGPAYEQHLSTFFARVRAAAHQPHLLIVVVKIRLFGPTNSIGADIRAAQDRVGLQPDTLLVTTDDLPSPADDPSGAVHLVYPDGYVTESNRIVAAIRSR